ncbi:MAG: hypothetical protein MR440_03780 [Firmicutes bacterium]|nr:hypothetical protein [Bacillota bacterium]
MRKDEIVMLNEKAAFIAQLESALLSDEERSGLDSICYEYDLTAHDEVITVIFEGGGTKKILATANSNGANAKAIINAIYG